MQLLVSDANIFIDMDAGELLEEFFSLPFELMTPDVLYHDELADEHPNLLAHGLRLGTLDGDEMNLVTGLIENYQGPSRIDCVALVLAKKEGCPLLSGDKSLAAAARAEGVIVNGTIWVIEQLIIYKIVDTRQANEALSRMQARGRRLPWDIARKRVQLLEDQE